MGQYQFTHQWKLQTTPERVWELISDFEQIESWKGVSVVKVQDQGHPLGIGDRYRMKIRTKFGYRLSFYFIIVEKKEQSLIRLEATGDLEGYGIFRLKQSGEYTHLYYHWEVQTVKPWMRLCEPWLRPFFVWNHNHVIGQGIRGLNSSLDQSVIL